MAREVAAPGWVKIGAKCRYWSESQKTFFSVVVTSIDLVKRKVVVHFEQDTKVWKSVPFSSLGTRGLLRPVEEPNPAGKQTKETPPIKVGTVPPVKEAEEEDGTATPQWYELLATAAKAEAEEKKKKEVEEKRRSAWRQAEQKLAQDQKQTAGGPKGVPERVENRPGGAPKRQREEVEEDPRPRRQFREEASKPVDDTPKPAVDEEPSREGIRFGIKTNGLSKTAQVLPDSRKSPGRESSPTAQAAQVPTSLPRFLEELSQIQLPTFMNMPIPAAEFYGERICAIFDLHEPDKLADVPLLLEKYLGCERELYEYLCQRYGREPEPAPPNLGPEELPERPAWRRVQVAAAGAPQEGQRMEQQLLQKLQAERRQREAEAPKDASPPDAPDESASPAAASAPSTSTLLARFQSLMKPAVKRPATAPQSHPEQPADVQPPAKPIESHHHWDGAEASTGAEETSWRTDWNQWGTEATASTPIKPARAAQPRAEPVESSQHWAPTGAAETSWRADWNQPWVAEATASHPNTPASTVQPPAIPVGSNQHWDGTEASIGAAETSQPPDWSQSWGTEATASQPVIATSAAPQLILPAGSSQHRDGAAAPRGGGETFQPDWNQSWGAEAASWPDPGLAAAENWTQEAQIGSAQQWESATPAQDWNAQTWGTENWSASGAAVAWAASEW